MNVSKIHDADGGEPMLYWLLVYWFSEHFLPVSGLLVSRKCSEVLAKWAWDKIGGVDGVMPEATITTGA